MPDKPVYVRVGGVLQAWDGAAWAPVGAGTVAFEADGGATILASSQTLTAAQMIVKTGTVSAYTTIKYGNSYMPLVTFREPFPSRILSVQVTAVYKPQGWDTRSTITPMVDIASTTGFRVVYPGETSSQVHAYMWTAIGC